MSLGFRFIGKYRIGARHCAAVQEEANIANFFVSSASHANIAQWQASTAYSVGNIIRQLATPAFAGELCYRCTTAGTSHTTEPVWLGKPNTVISDNTAGWTECTGQAAYGFSACHARVQTSQAAYHPGGNTFTSGGTGFTVGDIVTHNIASYGIQPQWRVASVNTGAANAVTGLVMISHGNLDSTTAIGGFTAIGGTGSGLTLPGYTPVARTGVNDTIYVGHNHAETQSTSLSILHPAAFSGNLTLICVDTGCSLPPVAADLRTTASITTTGNSSMTVACYFSGFVYGINISCGTTSAPSFSLGTYGAFSIYYVFRWENCSFKLGSTGAAGNLVFSGKNIILNSTIEFGNINQSITTGVIANALLNWTGGALLGVGPYTLTSVLSNITGVDLSIMVGSSKTIFGFINRLPIANCVIEDCKLGAGVRTASMNNTAYPTVSLIRCDTGGLTSRHEKHMSEGSQTIATNVYRNSGASDGTTPISWCIVTSASTLWLTQQFVSFPIAIWNTVVGSPVTVTIFGLGVLNTIAAKDDEIWFELAYLNSSSTQSVTINCTKSSFLSVATTRTADSTSIWSAGLTARANSTAYVLGNVVSTSSNPDRLFVCTVAGTTSASLPGGYATAIDGGIVTDGGTAQFTAARRFSMSVTFTAATIGYIHATVKAAKPSATYYIDPLLVLS